MPVKRLVKERAIVTAGLANIAEEVAKQAAWSLHWRARGT
jgi:hypothetical protein